METIREKSFEDIYSHIIGEIERGAVDRKHSFHLCFFSTFIDEFPESRTVVLRKLERSSFTLRFHTDSRSDKYRQVLSNKNTQILLYNQKAKLQVRLKCHSINLDNEKIKQDVWNKSQEISRRCYYVPSSPSSMIDKPILNSDIDFKNESLGYNVFSIIESNVLEMDVLELNYEGHVRAKFEINNGKLIKAFWLMP
jgi:3-hydroxyisobutyrate dehydrogenase